MPGIYIHIPFCSSKCRYCDFFSRTVNNQQVIDDYVNALCKEIKLQKNYLGTNKIDTIYFGGGTPSTLNIRQLNQIFDAISSNFEINSNPEITFEANPEDLTKDYLFKLRNNTIVNRLSIGIQSFNDEDLQLMNRRHSVEEAISVIKNAKNIGFTNISCDLIFGLPNQTIEKWENNLQTFFDLKIPHLSAYNLTIEEGTVFGLWKEKGRIKEISDELSLQMFENLINIAENHNFTHYETSNFSKKDYIAKHNFSYWTGEKYLGLGASAHSFDRVSRQWNVANINQYISDINKNITPAEKEVLTKKDVFNEFIMTGLRTFSGIKISRLENEFAEFYGQIRILIKEYLNKNLIFEKNGHLILTKQGKFVSNAIMADLMIV